MPYLPYEAPGITVILSLSSFLILLNGVRYALDHLLYCGILGEILIGIVWGVPVGGTACLTQGTQEAIQALGYLGLISLVFEGGLSTDLTLLGKSAYTSISIATVGLLMPIALSFILLVLPFSNTAGTTYPSPLAAFSAGASLCSTSLGTTFAILSSANLQRTRVGVVLVGAAMMDDVVGLVMVNIVTALGSGGTKGWAIARPIVSSFGLLLVVLSLMAFVIRPIWTWLSASLSGGPRAQTSIISSLRKTSTTLLHHIPGLNLILSTLVLIILVTIASFINASVLFAAFIAGGVVNYVWSITNSAESTSDQSPLKLYQQYYKQLVDFVLVPFFFASIGFSIPITSMFVGSILWKGVVYSLLMIIAKGCVSSVMYFEYCVGALRTMKSNFSRRRRKVTRVHPVENAALDVQLQPISASRLEIQNERKFNKAPHSIALLVGFAMVSRGEIGFLIASLSQSSGTLIYRLPNESGSTSSGEEIFLVITWAVALCTVAGPLGVGLIVRRLKQQNTESTWLLEDQHLDRQQRPEHSLTRPND